MVNIMAIHPFSLAPTNFIVKTKSGKSFHNVKTQLSTKELNRINRGGSRNFYRRLAVVVFWEPTLYYAIFFHPPQSTVDN